MALDSFGDMLEFSIGQNITSFGLYKIRKVLHNIVGVDLWTADEEFAASELITLLFLASHSLGLLNVDGIHDRTNAPAPNMLLGQAFAASLTAWIHYSSKRKQLERDLGVSKRESRVEKAMIKLFTANIRG